MSYLTHLECSLTAETFPSDQIHGLSPAGRPLLARYDLDAIKTQVDRDVFRTRDDGFWAYRELLPIQNWPAVPRLGEVKTPLISLNNLHGEQLIVKGLSKMKGVYQLGHLSLVVWRWRWPEPMSLGLRNWQCRPMAMQAPLYRLMPPGSVCNPS